MTMLYQYRLRVFSSDWCRMTFGNGSTGLFSQFPSLLGGVYITSVSFWSNILRVDDGLQGCNAV